MAKILHGAVIGCLVRRGLGGAAQPKLGCCKAPLLPGGEGGVAGNFVTQTGRQIAPRGPARGQPGLSADLAPLCRIAHGRGACRKDQQRPHIARVNLHQTQGKGTGKGGLPGHEGLLRKIARLAERKTLCLRIRGGR